MSVVDHPGAMAPQVSARLSRTRSGFDNLVLLADKAPPTTGDLIGVLLASTFPLHSRGCEVLRPLWAEEAMHRAYCFMRLIETRDRRDDANRDNPLAAGVENFVARDLTARLRRLATDNARVAQPCSTILRDVVADLGTLFGSPANVTIASRIDAFSLPAYKRRALVLVAVELLANAFLHAFRDRDAGVIEVDLIRRGHSAACLRIADNGIGFNGGSPNLHCGVAAGLADLLAAELSYDRTAGWTIAEIVFPMRDC